MTREARLSQAYAECERRARAHYENFPVASRLLPRRMRPHVAAVYAFARAADDMADEGEDPGELRRARLAGWRNRLHAAAVADLPGEAGDDLIFVALGHSIRTLDLPVSLFDDLVSAFEQDTMTTRYDSWDALLDYCRRSADPVGRLVLRIAGHHAAALDRSSDALCSALQLTNFWQDFGRDWRSGRLYVPRDLVASAGAHESDLAAGLMTSEWVAALDECVRFTRALFDRGRRVCDLVPGRLGFELRATWNGGRLVLDRVADRLPDALIHRPALGAGDLPLLFWRTLTWRVAAR